MTDLTTDITNDITIILPCAGAGSRMGLDSPKELFEISGRKLIDFSLDHIKAYIRALVHDGSSTGSFRVAVVIRLSKREVADYVRAQLPDTRVETVLFDDNYEEWPGSVYSAHKQFSGRNLVLLPDSFLSLSSLSLPSTMLAHPENNLQPITVFPDGEYRDRTLIAAALEVLAQRPVMFGWVACDNPGVLSTMGALRVEKNEVTAFQDKPREGLEGFNGFWTCYGFSPGYGGPLYDFLIQSLRHQSPKLAEQPFFPPSALQLGRYYDLGTPERVASFMDSVLP